MIRSLRGKSIAWNDENPLLEDEQMNDHLCIMTIGVYGFDEQSFFSALTNAEVDTFCDIRRRRGLRGSAYAFANSRRLQERLAALGIRYIHMRELAPSSAVRDIQKVDDNRRGVGKRRRVALSPAFILMLAVQFGILSGVNSLRRLIRFEFALSGIPTWSWVSLGTSTTWVSRWQVSLFLHLHYTRFPNLLRP